MLCEKAAKVARRLHSRAEIAPDAVSADLCFNIPGEAPGLRRIVIAAKQGLDGNGSQARIPKPDVLEVCRADVTAKRERSCTKNRINWDPLFLFQLGKAA